MTSVLIFIMLCLIWGSTWLGIKIGLEDSPPFLSAGFRFLVATIILYLLAQIKGIDFRKNRGKLKQIFLPGIFQYFFSYALVYWGEQFISSGLMAILFSTLPFFVAFYAFFILKNEKLGFWKIFGLILGFLGIIVIFSENLSLGLKENFWGMLAAVGSAACSALSTVLIKKNLKEVNPVVTATYQMALGSFFLLITGFSLEKLSDFKITFNSLGALLYLAIFGSAIAFVSYYWLLKKVEATKISVIAFITPIVAVFLGWLFLDEKIEWYMAFGTIFVFAGIGLVNYGGRIWKLRLQI
jgi:drug/metabolite transporter (DMT)-like permease